MPGVNLETFVDVFLATSQAILTGQKDLIVESQKRRTLLRQIYNSHEYETMLQGGDRITDHLIFNEDRTFGPYNPLAPKTPHLANLLTENVIDWAFCDAHVTFDIHERGINSASELNAKARAYKFKDVIYAKWAGLWTDQNNGMERLLMGQPNAASMEGASLAVTRVPFPVFATIHEFGADDSAGAVKPTATVPPGFTTLQGIDPTAQPLWRNPVEFYATAGPTSLDPNAAAPTPNTIQHTPRWDGFSAFSRMWNRLSFEELAIEPQYGEPTEPEGMIICSLRGHNLIEANTSYGDDHRRTGGSRDASYLRPGLQYNGVPIKYVEMMDHAEVWKDAAGTGFSGEFDASTDEDGVAHGTTPEWQGPRFPWIVPKYFKVIMHRENFLKRYEPPASAEMPYTRTVYFNSWYNVFNRSRQRAGGIVAPRADVITGF